MHITYCKGDTNSWMEQRGHMFIIKTYVQEHVLHTILKTPAKYGKNDKYIYCLLVTFIMSQIMKEMYYFFISNLLNRTYIQNIISNTLRVNITIIIIDQMYILINVLRV